MAPVLQHNPASLWYRTGLWVEAEVWDGRGHSHCCPLGRGPACDLLPKAVLPARQTLRSKKPALQPLRMLACHAGCYFAVVCNRRNDCAALCWFLAPVQGMVGRGFSAWASFFFWLGCGSHSVLPKVACVDDSMCTAQVAFGALALIGGVVLYKVRLPFRPFLCSVVLTLELHSTPLRWPCLTVCSLLRSGRATLLRCARRHCEKALWSEACGQNLSVSITVHCYVAELVAVWQGAAKDLKGEAKGAAHDLKVSIPVFLSLHHVICSGAEPCRHAAGPGEGRLQGCQALVVSYSPFASTAAIMTALALTGDTVCGS